MAIGVIWHPAVDQQAYDAAKERVFQAAQDAGMRFHAAGNSPEGWRIIEVWDSREGLDGFIDQHLAPAINELSGGQAPPPEPEAVFDIHYQMP